MTNKLIAGLFILLTIGKSYGQQADSVQIPFPHLVSRFVVNPFFETKKTFPLFADTLLIPTDLIPIPFARKGSEIQIDREFEFITIIQTVDGFINKIPFTAPVDWYVTQMFISKRRESFIQTFTSVTKSVASSTKSGHGQAMEVIGVDVGDLGRVSLHARGNVNISGKMVFQDQQLVRSSINETQNTHLEFDQKENFNVQGKVGDRVSVFMDHDSERDFDWENNIRIKYEGKEDEIVQKIEAGNVSLSLPGSQALMGSAGHSGLFGIKTISKFGPLDVTAIASVVETKREQQEYTGNNEAKTQQIKDTDYVKNKYFFIHELFRNGIDTTLSESHRVVVPPFYPLNNGLHNIGSVIVRNFELYKLDNTTNSESEEGTAHADLNNPDESLDQTGNFKRLELAQEYSIVEDLGFIRLRQRAQDEVFGCSYILVDRSSGDTVLTVGEPISVDNELLKLKMLKPRSLTLDHPTYDLMFKNVYYLGTTKINREGFEVRIVNNRLPVPSHLDPLGTPFITLFGLDSVDESGNRQADELIDISNPNIISLDNGELIFPTFFPFANDSLSGGTGHPDLQEVLGTGIMYTTTDRTQIDNDSRFTIEVDYSNQSSTISLGFMIVENSEQVLKNGIPLKKGIDYSVDYFSGTLVLLDETDPNAEIRILFDKHELVSFDKKTILGVRGQMDINEHSYLGLTALYFNQSVINEKIEVGYEPMRNFMWGMNGRVEQPLDGLSRWLDKLPVIETDRPSSFSVEGEIAQIIPNPNPINNSATGDPDGVAFIDDFEGAKRTTTIPIQRRFWKESSAPVDPITGNPMRQFNRARTNWYNPYGQVRTKDIWPNLSTSIRAQNETTDILIMKYTPRTVQADTDVDSIWGGIITPLYSGDNDQTSTKFFEIWAKGSGVNLSINLGQISEDRDGNGELNTEDIPAGGLKGDGILQDAEDVGLDGCSDAQEDGWGGCLPDSMSFSDLFTSGDTILINSKTVDGGGDVDPTDPNGDNWSYSEGSINYDHINGTEGNALDAGRYPDTEDLDRTNYPDMTNDYFTIKFGLDDETYFSGETKDNGIATGWKLYRVPLVDFSKIDSSKSQEWNNIQHMRLVLTGGDKNSTSIVQIAKIELVGNDWKEMGIAADTVTTFSKTDSDSIFAISVINTEDNASYQPPSGVEGEYDRINQIQSKEQSLVLSFTDLPAGNKGAAMKSGMTLSGDRAKSYLTYDRMKMYIYGLESNWVKSVETDVEFFLQFGFEGNYYEVTQPVYAGWDETVGRNSIDLDLNWLSALKLTDAETRKIRDSDIITDSSGVKEYQFTDESENPTGKRIKIVGSPALNRIQFFIAGIQNKSDGPITGEIWIDELRLSGVKKDKGVSLRLSSKFTLADIMNTSFAYNRQDADFHTLQQRLGSNNTTERINVNSSFSLHKFLPKTWGISIPLSTSFAQSVSTPKYFPGQDILVDEGSPPDSILSKSQSVNLSLKLSKTSRSDNSLVKYTLDKVTASINSAKSVSSDAIQKEVLNQSYSGKISYALPFGRDNYFSPFKWLESIPWVGGKLAETHIYYTPTSVNTSASFSEKLTQKTSRVGGKSPDIYNLGLSRDFSVDYSLTDNIRNKYSWNAKSDMDDYRGYAWLALKNTDPGIVTDVTESFTTSFSPTIFSWLKPNLNYSAGYRWNQNLDSNVDGANIGTQLRFSSSVSLTPKTLVELIYKPGGKAAASNQKRGRGRPSEKNEETVSEPEEPKKDNIILASIHKFMGRINPISVSYTENLSRTGQGVQGEVPLGYKFGWLPDHGLSHSEKVGTNIGSWTHKRDLSMRSGFKFGKNITTSFNFTQNLGRSISGGGVEQQNLTRDFLAYGESLENGFPFSGWSLRWSGVEKWPIINKIAKSASLEHALTGKETRSWQFDQGTPIATSFLKLSNYIQANKDFERTSRISQSFSPLVGLTMSLNHGVSMSLRHNKSRSVEGSYNGGQKVFNDQSVTATASYSHRGGFTIPLVFFRDFSIQNTVNFSLNFDMSESEIKQKTLTAEKFALTAFNTSWHAAFRVTYTFNSKVTGSMVYEYRESDSMTTGKKVDRDFGFDVNIAITG
ncbi:MAG: cell surface protein SprA [Candidatus Marinimicrobia bacterium]|nr:cell surface protein SprA [Candidatus Neomarinimicrobiota bacterium]MBT3618700.1 cell surface protein SprA [Candidatus Neomarinimicrobiota bacterium]MBT3829517.1 cell surface protein SprA [Candidatus Neomarinimicrobiota bacterium]MBT3997607.1 cell surface protein SprA [Candidatus Neomarinimicrobiota bacterium]MBT4281412.1 cell surface protein SprA [Candidatus Neomarinimicrobiota bacterium]